MLFRSPTEFNVLRGLAQARVRADGRGWLCTGFPMKGPYADPVMEEGCVKPPGGCSGRASTGPSGAPSGATRGRRRDFREPASWRRNGGAVVAAPSVGRRSRLSTLPAKPALQVGVSSSWFQGLSTSTRLSIIRPIRFFPQRRCAKEPLGINSVAPGSALWKKSPRSLRRPNCGKARFLAPKTKNP